MGHSGASLGMAQSSTPAMPPLGFHGGEGPTMPPAPCFPLRCDQSWSLGQVCTCFNWAPDFSCWKNGCARDQSAKIHHISDSPATSCGHVVLHTAAPCPLWSLALAGRLSWPWGDIAQHSGTLARLGKQQLTPAWGTGSDGWSRCLCDPTSCGIAKGTGSWRRSLGPEGVSKGT